jgi:hypothetical protein
MELWDSERLTLGLEEKNRSDELWDSERRTLGLKDKIIDEFYDLWKMVITEPWDLKRK